MGRIPSITMQHEQAVAERIHETFAAAVEQLPLENCSLRRDSFFDTGLEFHAPEGWAFRATDEFEDDWTSSGDYPTPSQALHDKRAAEGEVICPVEDYYDPRDLRSEFIGDRLSIRVGDVPFGALVSQQQLQTARSFDVTARIAAPPEYCATFGESTKFQWEERTGSDIWHSESILSDVGGIGFHQESIVAKLGDASISLIRHTFPQPKFVIVKSKYDHKLQIVETPGGISISQFREYLNSAGIVASEEALRAEMRKRRLIGMPFSDDPLRSITIMQDNPSGRAVGVIDAIREAEASKEDLGKDADDRWFQRQDQRRKERFLATKRQQHQTSLVPIEDDQNLAQAVATHAAPGWLDRLLDKDSKDWDVEF